ncbi:uncharacterized protein LOC124922209 [Impatiens glandulifera]|uniref:uncharacterized protein LOC124922209 n=1 Tax=Impatiens glandulifera TaxID=253017 RepID=UPI001FB09ECE|nr:uncharacterized protein LOC124922209 [Impatiens glandulifera]
MHPPSVEFINWHGRPRIPTTNVLAICDHDLLFTYFASGVEGSYHDTHVLNTCRTTETLHFPEPLSSKFYICDSGYVNKPGFMAPYRYRRYHPHEFEHNAPDNSEEFFNLIHSGLRSVIERMFGVWKNK